MSELNALGFPSHLAKNPALSRDTQILNGTITNKDRALIAQRWNRAGVLGLHGIMRVKQIRDQKRGFEL